MAHDSSFYYHPTNKKILSYLFIISLLKIVILSVVFTF